MSDEFTVNDKRLFNKEGQLNEGVEASEAAPQKAPEAPAEPEKKADEASACGCGSDGAGMAETDSAGARPPLPPANFASLLVGLATSAFIHLGEGPNGGENPPDLDAAKHAIDLLAVLQTKTEGNLEQEEDELLTALLYDLRVKFVQASQKK